jgi:hypothetical protein
MIQSTISAFNFRWFESKMFLCQITENNYDTSGEYLSNGRIEIEMFNKKLEENIIKKYTYHHHKHIPE